VSGPINRLKTAIRCGLHKGPLCTTPLPLSHSQWQNVPLSAQRGNIAKISEVAELETRTSKHQFILMGF